MNALEFLNEVQRLYAAQDYVAALTTIAAAETEGKATVELLLLKAACFQLFGDTDYPLRKAFDIYESILRCKPNDARALTEAGFFLLNVEDNAAEAERYFARAVAAYSDQMSEAIAGLVRAKNERSTSSRALVADIEIYLEELRIATVRRL